MIKLNYSAILLAAGSGTRLNLGYNKVFYKFSDGKTIIEKSVEAFEKHPLCNQIILVISSQDEQQMSELFGERVEYVIGGSTRQQSSYHGLQLVRNDRVLIHDGARCFVSQRILDDCVAALMQYDAVCVMVPAKDTIKRVIGGVIEETYDRSTLMCAQTPQGFKTKLIKQCTEVSIIENLKVTDDASIVEMCSDVDVHVVMGDYDNIKITTIEDIRE